MALLLLRRRLPCALHRCPRAATQAPRAPRRWHSGCQSSGPARTRFAPSPTGLVHLGSLRTALYNYLLAKSTGGQFLLRIEDTDAKRTVPGAEQAIYDTLNWAGLQWDEGPGVGGSCGPYRQSERVHLHRQHAQQLLDNQHAYRCFCTAERLTALGAARKRAGFPTEYDRTCFNLSREESDARAAGGEAHVVRLISPDKYPGFVDLVYGKVGGQDKTHAHAHGAFEDPVLLKSDGSPTYHLANVVDDHYMNITHVVRATEWMPSTPKHMYLYECFGWKPPAFVHVGLLQDHRKQKMSKRHGDVFVMDYKDQGYLPEALLNFVALLGWSHSAPSDVMTLEELVKKFDTKGLTEGNTVVDFGKLGFLQKEHARAIIKEGGAKEEALVTEVEKEVRQLFGDSLETGEPLTKDYIRRVVHANAQNFLVPNNFVLTSAYFFRDLFVPANDHSSSCPPPDEKPVRSTVRALKRYADETGTDISEMMHQDFLDPLQKIETWDLETIKQVVKMPEADAEEKVQKRWKVGMRMLRAALSFSFPGPGLADTMGVLGRERSLERMRLFAEERLKALGG